MSDLLEMFEDAYTEHKYKMRVASTKRELAWQDEGLCKETDPNLFYPETGDNAKPAKSICRSCPVQLMCAQYAIDNKEEFGIWGGLSAETTKRLRRRGNARITQKQLDRILRGEDAAEKRRVTERRKW